jgi:hypothetical protein
MNTDVRPKKTTGKREQAIFTAFIDLDALIQEYRQALLWLAFGNYQEHRPTEKQTRQTIKTLKEKIVALLTDIEKQTQ